MACPPPGGVLAVLTRPAGRNEGLAARLQQAGVDTLIAPALVIDFLPVRPPVPRSGDLSIFVSRQAVEAYFSPPVAAWPPGAWAAAVGASTAQALKAHVPAAQVLCPSTAQAPDSEALLAVIEAHGLPPAQAHVLRAQTGREWLAQALRARGWSVHYHALYARRAARWDRTVCECFLGAPRAVLLLTSGAACDAIAASLTRHGLRWPAPLSVVTLHARIARRLQCCYAADRAGSLDVRLSMPDEAHLFQAILAAAHDSLQEGPQRRHERN